MRKADNFPKISLKRCKLYIIPLLIFIVPL
nr:MAG TPA: hypothetical protein [Caudoviricetes sp.]